MKAISVAARSPSQHQLDGRGSADVIYERFERKTTLSEAPLQGPDAHMELSRHAVDGNAPIGKHFLEQLHEHLRGVGLVSNERHPRGGNGPACDFVTEHTTSVMPKDPKHLRYGRS